MKRYEVIAENAESTVVSDYKSNYKRQQSYQSEDALEKAFIKLLEEQGYQYLSIHTEEELITNLRTQIEKLNDYVFTDNEWNIFFSHNIANGKLSMQDKAEVIQKDPRVLLTRDNGETKNISLIDKKHIHSNCLQVINQYETEDGARKNRYDVTVLINGLPMVHIELKKRGVDIKEAFNQINRYQRDSFWSGKGLFEYVQIFVISNGTHTKYYSNTTRQAHVDERNKHKKRNAASRSFEFTSWWADAQNRPIAELMDFGQTFFAKHTLLNIITRFCIFTTDKNLMVMRPYQVVATERIINRICMAHNYNKQGTIDAGGYIWHTTGSGKTLTSFKSARIASQLEEIDKVLFVVDRKDLDYQTMKEYDSFEKGCANSNSSTRVLRDNLNNPSSKIIITTIQKLSNYLKRYNEKQVLSKEIVFIFDECHRSQFGEMHTAITKNFKKYYLFGFTGTPIFASNSNNNGKIDLKTTEQAFGEKLHTYTIVDAISDKNVLPFRIDYVSTVKEKENIKDEQVSNIDREKVLRDPRRVSNIVKYILEHFNQKTKRNECYKHKDRAINGFNSIFAVPSIEMAKIYYHEFKKQMATLPSDKQLKIATIFSFGANDEVGTTGLLAEENSDDTSNLNQSDRDFLDDAIKDYNQLFNVSYDTSSDKFPNFYKDVSLKLKNKELDLLIVVNMFLTGFDAPTLNTLWVDKNLRQHGLLQAFSRTNRILNSVKVFGNIVCFRNLEEETNKCLALFGDKSACGVVLLKKYEDYYNGYTDEKTHKEVKGYKELIEELQTDFPLEEKIVSESEQKRFISLYGGILKSKNILDSFDNFKGNEILSEGEFQDYQSVYIDLYNTHRKGQKHDVQDVNDDIIFEMELIKQVETNIDYIINLVNEYQKSNHKDKTILSTISKAINSSVDLRNKKELIEKFIESLTPESDTTQNWSEFVEQERKDQLDQIISEEKLKQEKAYSFMESSFRKGWLDKEGSEIWGILNTGSRFGQGKKTNNIKKRDSAFEKLLGFFKRFYDIISPNTKF